VEHVLEGLKAIAEETRLRLLVICHDHEFTVTELTKILGQSQPRVSRHLKLLCDAGILERFREQTFVLYRVSDRGEGAQLAHAILDLLDVNEEVFRLDQLRIRDIVADRAREAEKTLAHLPSSFHSIQAHKIDTDQVDGVILNATRNLPIGNLLDIGTGTGRMLRILGSRTDHAVGIDISPQMLRLARAQLSEAGLGKFSIRYGDMYHLDFPNHSFDTVTMDQVLADSEDPERVLEEACRLIRPGGNLIIVTYQSRAGSKRITNWKARIQDCLDHQNVLVSQAKRVKGGQGDVLVLVGKKPLVEEGIA